MESLMKKKLGEVLLANPQDPPRGSFLIPQFIVKYPSESTR